MSKNCGSEVLSQSNDDFTQIAIAISIIGTYDTNCDFIIFIILASK